MNLNVPSTNPFCLHAERLSISSYTPNHSQVTTIDSQVYIIGSSLILIKFQNTKCMHPHTPLEMLLTGRVAHGFETSILTIKGFDFETEEGIDLTVRSREPIQFPPVQLVFVQQPE